MNDNDYRTYQATIDTLESPQQCDQLEEMIQQKHGRDDADVASLAGMISMVRNRLEDALREQGS